MNELRRVSIPNEVLLTQVGELVATGHHVTIRVRGNSMNPFFVDRRDEVVLSPFGKENIKVGKVILARDKDGRYILHRIIKIEGEDIVMMGDGNLKGVEHTTADEVLGLVTGAVRKGKQVACSGFCWELYSRCWLLLCPVRRWLLAIWRRFLV